jgi:hypothetical protein
MPKTKDEKQAIVSKTVHKRLSIERHEPHWTKLINYYRNFNKTTTTGATIGARVVQTEVLLVVICRPLYFVFPFFFLSLYCLSFFKLQFLITSLVSSIFSSTWALWKNMHLSNSCVFLYLDFSSVPTVSKPNVNVQTLKSRQNSERQ